jgi:hypothetical protein
MLMETGECWLAFEEADEFAGFSTSFSEISRDLRIARYPASPPTGNSEFLMSFPEFPSENVISH